MNIKALLFVGIVVGTVGYSMQQKLVVKTVRSKLSDAGIKLRAKEETSEFPLSYSAKDITFNLGNLPAELFFNQLTLYPWGHLKAKSGDGSINASINPFNPQSVELDLDSFDLASLISTYFRSGTVTGSFSGNIAKEAEGSFVLSNVVPVYPGLPNDFEVLEASTKVRTRDSIWRMTDIELNSSHGHAEGSVSYSGDWQGRLVITPTDPSYSSLLASMSGGQPSEQYIVEFVYSKKSKSSFKVSPG